MPDITMCKSKLCPIRKKCYRFKAKPDELQSYFIEKFPCKLGYDNYISVKLREAENE